MAFLQLLLQVIQGVPALTADYLLQNLALNILYASMEGPELNTVLGARLSTPGDQLATGHTRWRVILVTCALKEMASFLTKMIATSLYIVQMVYHM